MAILRFDVQNLHVDVLVGVNERYTPRKKIVEFHKKIEEFKREFSEYLIEEFGTDKNAELLQILQSDEQKHEKFKKYAKEQLEPRLKGFKEEADNINKKLQKTK